MAQETQKSEWGNPGALGLVAFGFSTVLLQIYNVGLITNVVPLVFGFFWGGLGQVIAGIIDGKRGDTFGLTAFTSYGLFWMALSSYFFMQWAGIAPKDADGLGWMCIIWGIFTGLMTIGTFKMTYIHITIFSTLTLLFFLLAGHFIGGWSGMIPGIEGIICGLSAIYGGVAVTLNTKWGRTVCPMGICK